MHNSINNLALIKDQIKSKFGLVKNLNIIAVSKTFPMSEINPLIENGQIHFGENKVQEAIDKWSDIKKLNVNLKLDFSFLILNFLLQKKYIFLMRFVRYHNF